jgi:hypothetical protein
LGNKEARFRALLFLIHSQESLPELAGIFRAQDKSAHALRRYGTRTRPSWLRGTMANRAETPGDIAARYRAMAAAARRRARSSDWATRLLLLQVAEKYMAMARNAVEGAKRGVPSSGHG